MPVTRAKSYRFTEEDIGQIAELADIWGGIRPTSETDVIREAVRRCLEAERKKARTARTNGARERS